MSTLVLEDIGASTPGLPLRLQFDSNDGVDLEVTDTGSLNIIPDDGIINVFEPPASGALNGQIRIFATGTPFLAGDMRLQPSAVSGSVGNSQTNGKMGAGLTSNSSLAAQSDETNGAPIFNGNNAATSGTRSCLNLDYTASTPNDETSQFMEARDATALRAQMWSNGDWENANNSYGAISDESLKQDIIDADPQSQWDDLKAMQFRKWRFKSDVAERGDDALTCLGCVGQEMEGVSPGLVRTTSVKQRVEETILDDGSIVRHIFRSDDGPPLKSIKYSVLYMKGMVALQEAMRRIEVLEANA